MGSLFASGPHECISPDGRGLLNTLSASIAAGETGPLITLSGSVDITNLGELSEVLADPRVNGTLLPTH
jgi:hypothetical protein